METLFWFCVLGSVYSYAIYPLILLALPFRPQRIVAQTQWPPVSVIIAAHNEAGRIAAKIENALACDYPRERLEIMVASDGSDDDTDAIVAGYAARGVRLVRSPQQGGKENVQRLASAQASGEIVVFSDVATRLDPSGLKELVRPFADPQVGAVSSEDRFVDARGRVAGEGAYVRYEMWLRQLEMRHAGLVGLSGSLFAARRELCFAIEPGTPSDFAVALACARRRLRAVVSSHGYYPDLADADREYARKYRTALRGMAGLWRHRNMLNPFRHRLFAFQLWSHKPLRWLVPWCFLGQLVAGSMLDGTVYRVLFAVQLMFLLLVIAGSVQFFRRHAAFRLAYFFAQANAALAHAAVAFVLGTRIRAWAPSRR